MRVRCVVCACVLRACVLCACVLRACVLCACVLLPPLCARRCAPHWLSSIPGHCRCTRSAALADMAQRKWQLRRPAWTTVAVVVAVAVAAALGGAHGTCRASVSAVGAVRRRGVSVRCDSPRQCTQAVPGSVRSMPWHHSRVAQRRHHRDFNTGHRGRDIAPYHVLLAGLERPRAQRLHRVRRRRDLQQCRWHHRASQRDCCVRAAAPASLAPLLRCSGTHMPVSL